MVQGSGLRVYKYSLGLKIGGSRLSGFRVF